MHVISTPPLPPLQVRLLQRLLEDEGREPEGPELTSALRPIMDKITREQPLSARERDLFADFKLR